MTGPLDTPDTGGTGGGGGIGGGPGGAGDPPPGSRGAALGSGALPDTAAVVAQVAAEADRAAEQAAGMAEQLRAEVGTLLTRLGGGPPAQLVEAQALAEAAAGALGDASAALHDATNGLRTFAGRTT